MYKLTAKLPNGLSFCQRSSYRRISDIESAAKELHDLAMRHHAVSYVIQHHDSVIVSWSNQEAA